MLQMEGTLLRIYHKLPAPLRSVAASLRGYYLRYWRYGTETDQLVAGALERDFWSPAR
jgi:phenylacetate-CoA ligase